MTGTSTQSFKPYTAFYPQPQNSTNVYKYGSINYNKSKRKNSCSHNNSMLINNNSKKSIKLEMTN